MARTTTAKPEPMRFPQIAAISRASLDGKVDFLAVQLDEAVAGIVKRLNDVGGSGALNVKLGFKMNGKQIEITATLSRSLPERDSRGFSAFVDRDGTLYEEDPRQSTLPFPANDEGAGPSGIVKEKS